MTQNARLDGSVRVLQCAVDKYVENYVRVWISDWGGRGCLSCLSSPTGRSNGRAPEQGSVWVLGSSYPARDRSRLPTTRTRGVEWAGQGLKWQQAVHCGAKARR